MKIKRKLSGYSALIYCVVNNKQTVKHQVCAGETSNRVLFLTCIATVAFVLLELFDS